MNATDMALMKQQQEMMLESNKSLTVKIDDLTGSLNELVTQMQVQHKDNAAAQRERDRMWSELRDAKRDIELNTAFRKTNEDFLKGMKGIGWKLAGVILSASLLGGLAVHLMGK